MDIERKYGFSIQVDPIPYADDFRVNLQSQEIAEIKADIEARVNESITMSMKDLWTRLQKAVSHMADRLSEKDSVFRDSLINNLIELTELLPKLNLTNYQNLETIRKDIENNLCSFSPQILREDGKEREKAAQKAQSILFPTETTSENTRRQNSEATGGHFLSERDHSCPRIKPQNMIIDLSLIFCS